MKQASWLHSSHVALQTDSAKQTRFIPLGAVWYIKWIADWKLRISVTHVVIGRWNPVLYFGTAYCVHWAERLSWETFWDYCLRRISLFQLFLHRSFAFFLPAESTVAIRCGRRCFLTYDTWVTFIVPGVGGKGAGRLLATNGKAAFELGKYNIFSVCERVVIFVGTVEPASPLSILFYRISLTFRSH